MHRANTDEPNSAGSALPNENGIAHFQQTNGNAGDGENMFPAHEYVRRDYVKRGPDERAPEIRPIPLTAAQAFCEPAKKIDNTQMKL